MGSPVPAHTEREKDMADGLGAAGPGAGMFNRLFDAGLDLGVNFGRKELGLATGPNQATRLGVTTPQLTAANFAPTTPAPGGGFQLDSKTILIGVALIVGAIVLAKL